MSDRYGRRLSEKFQGGKRDITFGRRVRLKAGKSRYSNRQERWYNRNASPVAFLKTDKYGAFVPTGKGSNLGFTLKNKNAASKLIHNYQKGKLAKFLAGKYSGKFNREAAVNGVLKKLGIRGKPKSWQQRIDKLLQFQDPRGGFKLFGFKSKKSGKGLTWKQRQDQKRNKLIEEILKKQKDLENKKAAKDKKGKRCWDGSYSVPCPPKPPGRGAYKGQKPTSKKGKEKAKKAKDREKAKKAKEKEKAKKAKEKAKGRDKKPRGAAATGRGKKNTKKSTKKKTGSRGAYKGENSSNKTKKKSRKGAAVKRRNSNVSKPLNSLAGRLKILDRAFNSSRPGPDQIVKRKRGRPRKGGPMHKQAYDSFRRSQAAHKAWATKRSGGKKKGGIKFK